MHLQLVLLSPPVDITSDALKNLTSWPLSEPIPCGQALPAAIGSDSRPRSVARCHPTTWTCLRPISTTWAPGHLYRHAAFLEHRRRCDGHPATALTRPDGSLSSGLLCVESLSYILEPLILVVSLGRLDERQPTFLIFKDLEKEGRERLGLVLGWMPCLDRSRSGSPSTEETCHTANNRNQDVRGFGSPSTEETWHTANQDVRGTPRTDGKYRIVFLTYVWLWWVICIMVGG